MQSVTSKPADRPRLATRPDLGPGVAQVVVPAMGTTMHLVVVAEVGAAPDALGLPALLERGRMLIEHLESCWSRFLPTSDISRLNRADGAWTHVAPATMTLLEQAQVGWHVTGGRFDPTVLPALEAAGYDATFDDVAARTPDAGLPDRRTGPAPGLGGLELDVERHRARLPVGVRVDPGGIGKGLAADMVVADLVAAGAAGAMANLGGDLRVAGLSSDSAGWCIEATLPGRSGGMSVVVADGGVATSTPALRRWDHGAGPAHHIIDPTTGRPAADAAHNALVVAGTAWFAEVLATALVLGDRDTVVAYGATGIVHDATGGRTDLPGMEAYLR